MGDEPRSVLITGASGGLGQAMALRFAGAGYDVLVNYHRDEAGAEAAAAGVRQVGRDALVVQGDVQSWEDVTGMVDAAVGRWGHLDCMVNNAGGAYRWVGPEGTPVLDLEEDAWDATVALNLKGAFLGIKAAARHMVTRGRGHIINIGSGAGLVGTPGRAAYSAAKAGVVGLTKAAARELGPSGVQINTVCPGLVLHEKLLEHEALSDEDVARAVAGKVLGRAGDANEFAAFVVQVAEMRNISGQTLNTDSRIVWTVPPETAPQVRTDAIRIGLRMPLGPELPALTEIAARADAAGFDSIWVGDHLLWLSDIESRYPYSPTGEAPLPVDTPFYDCLVLLAHLASVTTKVRLCTGVYVLPLRPALVTARAAATVDAVSHGRLTLGVGIGWLREEFEAAGVDYASRGPRTDETIGAMRALWGDAPASYRGAHVVIPPVHLLPHPPQGSALPIHVGGETPAARRRAAELGDGWVAMGQTPEAAAELVHDLRARRAAAGRADLPFEHTVGTNWPFEPALVRDYARAGVDRIVVSPWRSGSWPEALADVEAWMGEAYAVAASTLA